MLSKAVAKKVQAARRGLKWSKKYLEGTATYNGKPSRYNVKKYLPLLEVDFYISHMCCDVMKKNPAKNFKKVSGKVPITAQMACESVLRYSIWLKNGCNMFDSKSPVSNPMSFWTEQDVLEYIRRNDIEIASVYGFIAADYNGQTAFDDCGCKLCTTGCDRTGCIFCGFGAHLEKGEGRFERLKRTHPKQYDYCMNGGSYDSDGIWKPDKNGLGMKHVIDTLNSLYGEEFIKY
jgi:3'-phosphoadenosine 5'-phosphosulfate sulfotransferase (PAPS reductase)/FAD synthetase